MHIRFLLPAAADSAAELVAAVARRSMHPEEEGMVPLADQLVEETVRLLVQMEVPVVDTVEEEDRDSKWMQVDLGLVDHRTQADYRHEFLACPFSSTFSLYALFIYTQRCSAC